MFNINKLMFIVIQDKLFIVRTRTGNHVTIFVYTYKIAKIIINRPINIKCLHCDKNRTPLMF